VEARKRFRGAKRRASDLVRVPAVRRSWWLRVSRPENLFQPHNDTWMDRYPDVFGWLQREIEDEASVRLLSFGCSVGDEVFSLRAYFPEATIVGIDISRGNISECWRRRQQHGDQRMHFVRAGTVDEQLEGTYDAVLCMAVLRHGDLGYSAPHSCQHRITFEAFDKTVSELARCLKVGGYLVIEHSNFRFRDSSCASQFEIVASRELPELSAGSRPTPLFGRDNLRLKNQEYREVIFRKER
jgi:2-polyprenyl-3-methyl-5-hydroxy-6-metoxy-1,4-benzoquinol methylase